MICCFFPQPDYPTLVDTRANFEKNPKIRKNQVFFGFPGWSPYTLRKKIRNFWVRKNFFFLTRKSVSADCHTVKNRKISEKSRKFWPFLAYVVPKGPGCPDFHPKTPQKFFRHITPQTLGGCMIFRIFLFFPDFPKNLPLWGNQAGEKNNKSQQITPDHNRSQQITRQML